MEDMFTKEQQQLELIRRIIKVAKESLERNKKDQAGYITVGAAASVHYLHGAIDAKEMLLDMLEEALNAN